MRGQKFDIRKNVKIEKRKNEWKLKKQEFRRQSGSKRDEMVLAYNKTVSNEMSKRHLRGLLVLRS